MVMVICLEQGADLHMAQLMPLLLTVSCFSKIQIGFTFLVPAHPGSPGKRAVKRVCVCIVLYCILLNASGCVVAGKAETGRRQPEPWSTGDGGQCACSVAAPVGGTSSGGSELSSTSSSDLISEDWFLRFSEYRLEDYYAVQATIRSVASPRGGLGWTCPPHFC